VEDLKAIVEEAISEALKALQPLSWPRWLPTKAAVRYSGLSERTLLEKQLPKFLSENEIKKIIAYLQEHDPGFCDFVQLAIYTGCRRSELLGLRRNHINLEHNFLIVKGKGGKERVIPLFDDAKKILERHIHKEILFPKWSANWVSKKWKQIMDKLGLKFRFHDLRHTTASMALQGIPIQVICELLGHSNITITQIYSHLQPDIIRQALEATFSRVSNAGKGRHCPEKLVKLNSYQHYLGSSGATRRGSTPLSRTSKHFLQYQALDPHQHNIHLKEFHGKRRQICLQSAGNQQAILELPDLPLKVLLLILGAIYCIIFSITTRSCGGMR
jgi:site-specific recombinase XerC